MEKDCRKRGDLQRVSRMLLQMLKNSSASQPLKNHSINSVQQPEDQKMRLEISFHLEPQRSHHETLLTQDQNPPKPKLPLVVQPRHLGHLGFRREPKQP